MLFCYSKKRRKRYGNQNQQGDSGLHRKYVLRAEYAQFLFSALAVGVAVAVYFGLRGVLGTETVSWMCILGAVPFAAMGFIKYNGMPAEKLLLAVIRSELLMPKRLLFRPTNTYYEIMKPTIKKMEKERMKSYD